MTALERQRQRQRQQRQQSAKTRRAGFVARVRAPRRASMFASIVRAGRRAASASASASRAVSTTTTSGSSVMMTMTTPYAFVSATPASLASMMARTVRRGGSARARSTSSSSSAGKKTSEKGSDAVQRQEPQSGRYDEITDKWIPEKPVSVVEGASYGVVGLLGLGVAAAAVWFGANELLVTPREHKVMDAAVKKLEDDPRVRISLGAPLTGYGSESRSRSARHRVAHQIVIDGRGRERVRVQFYARGARGSATVHAEAGTNAETGELEFSYIIADVAGAHGTRIQVVSPQQQAQRLVAL